MIQQRRQTTLANRGRANIQVTAHTRDEIKRLAGEHGKSILDMVEVMVKAWNGNAKRVQRVVEGQRPAGAYEITFENKGKRIVFERTLSRAKALAAWERMQEGAEGFMELHVVAGVRRLDLDVGAGEKRFEYGAAEVEIDEA